MELFYNQGPNTTVMFYLSTLVPGNDGFADVVHRTFPGTYKNSVEYNPANRVWFKSAPVTGIALYGPYRVPPLPPHISFNTVFMYIFV